MNQLLTTRMALTLVIAWCGIARGDVIELANGGRIDGTIVESEPGTETTYTITTAAGGQIVVARADVKRIVPHTPRQEAVDQGLDHGPTGEQRKTREEIMAARGMVWYEGRYHTPQHVELLEQAKQVRVSEADWNNRLKRWRRWLAGRRQDRIDEALREISAIRDPLAAPGIVELLLDEQDQVVKRLLVDTAARIDDPQTTGALVSVSLRDPNEELRYQCLEHLIQSGRAGITAPYIRALGDPDNAIVNRAAESLATIGNRDAVGPLVNALVTMHKQQISIGSPNQHAYSFTPSGGTSMNFGGGGTKVVAQAIENRSVLTALVKLSGGANFGYDEKRWRDWLSTQAKANPVDVRRDR
jgi:hypothetical protein